MKAFNRQGKACKCQVNIYLTNPFCPRHWGVARLECCHLIIFRPTKFASWNLGIVAFFTSCGIRALDLFTPRFCDQLYLRRCCTDSTRLQMATIRLGTCVVAARAHLGIGCLLPHNSRIFYSTIGALDNTQSSFAWSRSKAPLLP